MRSEFIAGIGNAYADEILWAAMIHPYRKRTQLTSEEIGRLYHAMQTTLQPIVPALRHAHLIRQRERAHHQFLSHVPAGRIDRGDVMSMDR